jgi:NAD(P)-dependent dehydrogenase (short-subunit alcohol dehydrogenase family)
MEEMGGWQLEALVNNALTGFLKKHFHKLDSEELLSSFRQNVLPVVLITQAALGTFRKQRFGKIITILSSALANKPPVGWSEYVANKAYLLAMSKAWAAEYAKFNITANCISPTFMPTPLNADMDSRLVEEMKKSYPLQELLQPEEVAQTVHFLLKSTQQINGVNLLMNQGADIL